MNREQIRILIGEDDALVASDMGSELKRLGYKVELQAGTPHEVVTLAIRLKPHVIVLDLNIQGDTHGIDVAREIHDIARIPIVFVTNLEEEIIENEHAIPPPYRYITKPYNLRKLDEAIEELWASIGPKTSHTAA